VPTSPDTLVSSRMDAQRSGSSAYMLMSFCEIENLMPLKKSAEKSKMFQNLLKGQALSYFEHHLRRRFETIDSELPGNDLIEPTP
jgi:hypothetical protein